MLLHLFKRNVMPVKVYQGNSFNKGSYLSILKACLLPTFVFNR